MMVLFRRSTACFTAIVFSLGCWLVASELLAASPPMDPAAAHAATAETPEQLQARVAKLIEQLGDKQYLVRQAAQDELSRIGPDAFDALTQAESNSDIEICAGQVSRSANSHRVCQRKRFAASQTNLARLRSARG